MLLISADLEELIGLSDTALGDPARPAGRPSSTRRRHPEELGSSMTGEPGRRRESRRRPHRSTDASVGADRSPALVAGVVIAVLAHRACVAAGLLGRPGPSLKALFDSAPRRAPRQPGPHIDQPRPCCFLSGLAVAIGFRMNLFNIGVEGQYRVAAFVAAAVGRQACAARAAARRWSSSWSPWPRRRLGAIAGRPEGHPRASTR